MHGTEGYNKGHDECRTVSAGGIDDDDGENGNIYSAAEDGDNGEEQMNYDDGGEGDDITIDEVDGNDDDIPDDNIDGPKKQHEHFHQQNDGDDNEDGENNDERQTGNNEHNSQGDEHSMDSDFDRASPNRFDGTEAEDMDTADEADNEENGD